jgi:hypothetical protein
VDDYHKTMGQIAQVARCLVGGRDINGFPVPQAGIEDIGRLLGQLRVLLDKYDRQMIETARKYDEADNLSAPLKGNIEVRR